MNPIGRKIKLIVKMRNSTLGALARLVGVSHGTMSHWINHGMSDEALDRVCAALGVDREEVRE